MKKRYFGGFVLLMFIVIFVSGCTNPGNNEAKEVTRRPSFSQIAKTASEMENWSYLASTAKKLFGDTITCLKDDCFSQFGDLYQKYWQLDKTEGTVTYSNTAQLTKLATYSSKYSGNKEGPITIIKDAIITKGNGKTEKVNIVALTGWETTDSKATSTATALCVALEADNEYLYDAYYAILNTLEGDEETPLYLIGYSLGGMTAQQLAGLENLNNYFDVRYVITFGSAVIAPDKIDYDKTTVRRMVEPTDVGPRLSKNYDGQYTTKYGDKNAPVIRYGTYNTSSLTHTFFYHDEEVWKDVDILGIEDGNATITFNFANASWHEAPKTDAALNK